MSKLTTLDKEWHKTLEQYQLATDKDLKEVLEMALNRLEVEIDEANRKEL